MSIYKPHEIMEKYIYFSELKVNKCGGHVRIITYKNKPLHLFIKDVYIPEINQDDSEIEIQLFKKDIEIFNIFEQLVEDQNQQEGIEHFQQVSSVNHKTLSTKVSKELLTEYFKDDTTKLIQVDASIIIEISGVWYLDDHYGLILKIKKININDYTPNNITFKDESEEDPENDEQYYQTLPPRPF